jgi:hypothetical protein
VVGTKLGTELAIENFWLILRQPDAWITTDRWRGLLPGWSVNLGFSTHAGGQFSSFAYQSVTAATHTDSTTGCFRSE